MIKLPLYSLVAALYTGAVAEVMIGTLSALLRAPGPCLLRALEGSY